MRVFGSLAEEMPIHEDYRRALIAAAETDPEWYANLYDVGWPDAPHRALRNSTAQAWEAAGCPPDGKRPGEGDVIAHFASGGPIVRYETAAPMAGTTGAIEALSMWAGQGVTLARKSQPAADIVTELTSRLPGRTTPVLAAYDSVAGLADALRRAEAAHAKHEQETGQPDPDWPDWYARHMADESAAGQAAG